MGRRGLRVSINDVAVEAGLSRRTVYHHFPNRDALVGTVLRRTAAAFVAVIEPQVDDCETLVDQVAEVALLINEHREDIEFTLRLPQQADSLLAIVLTFHLDHLVDELVAFWAPRVAAAIDSGEVRADLDARQVAEWILRLTFSFALMPPVVVDLGPGKGDELRTFVRTHLRGITT